MPRYAVLLRGVNVGGHGKLPMAELRGLLDGLGCTDVATFLQSGNAVVTSSVRSAGRLAEQVAEAIAAARDKPVAVLVRTAAQLDAVVEQNPYTDQAASNPKMLHVAFLAAKPAAAAAKVLAAEDYAPGECTLIGDALYLRFETSSYDSRMATDAGKKAGVPATARNWNTVLAVQKMLHA